MPDPLKPESLIAAAQVAAPTPEVNVLGLAPPVESEIIRPKMFAPSEYPPVSHIGGRDAFAGIVGRNVSDYLMQSAQRHHMQLSQMADNKASMLITVSSLVLTVSISRLNDPELQIFWRYARSPQTCKI